MQKWELIVSGLATYQAHSKVTTEAKEIFTCTQLTGQPYMYSSGASHAGPRSFPSYRKGVLQNFHQPRQLKRRAVITTLLCLYYKVWKGLTAHVICPTICTPAQMDQNIRKNTPDNADFLKGNQSYNSESILHCTVCLSPLDETAAQVLPNQFVQDRDDVRRAKEWRGTSSSEWSLQLRRSIVFVHGFFLVLRIKTAHMEKKKQV